MISGSKTHQLLFPKAGGVGHWLHHQIVVGEQASLLTLRAKTSSCGPTVNQIAKGVVAKCTLPTSHMPAWPMRVQNGIALGAPCVGSSFCNAQTDRAPHVCGRTAQKGPRTRCWSENNVALPTAKAAWSWAWHPAPSILRLRSFCVSPMAAATVSC